MSDHDTSDASLVERLREAVSVLDEPYHRDAVAAVMEEAAAALARRIAEGERLKAILKQAAPWTCPECGPHTKVDEDEEAQ